MKTENAINSYEQSAQDFCARNHIGIRIALKDSKLPDWDDGSFRHHYCVSLNKPNRKVPLRFDFWGSVNDANEGKHPTAYGVLACISSDAFCPDTFADFCSEYGYDEDSRKAEKLFAKCARFGLQLREFFTMNELEELAEIR